MKHRLLARASRFLGSLRLNQRGNIIAIAAAGMPVMVGAAGLGTDTVQWYLWSRQMQQAADAAALAGAYAISQGMTPAAAEKVAEDYLIANAGIVLTTKDAVPLATGTYANRAVQVNLSIQRKLPFSGMLMSTVPNIGVSATAAVFESETAKKNCIVSLGTTGAGIYAAGGTVTMNCGAATNSRHESSAAIIDENFKVTSVSAVGQIEGTPATGTTLHPLSVPQEDPYRDLPPVTHSCTGNALNKNSPTPVPGQCYPGIKLTGNDKEVLNLPAGTYHIDGDIDLGGNAELVGEGVTLVLTKKSNFKITGNPVIKLTAPTSGDYKGVIIYQARDATTITERHAGDSAYYNKFAGNAGSVFEGAIYMPSQSVEFQGNSGVTSACLRIVAASVVFQGNTNIADKCETNAGVPIYGESVVRLVG